MAEAETSESFMALAGRKKLPNAPEGFEFFSWRCIGDTDSVLMRGGVPRLLKSGKRKGEKTWSGCVVIECVVNTSEIEAERQAFVAMTGKCGECQGTAKRWAGWHHERGHSYRECRSCGGTGKSEVSRG